MPSEDFSEVMSRILPVGVSVAMVFGLSKALPVKSAVDSLAGKTVSATTSVLAPIKQIDAISLFKQQLIQVASLVPVFIIAPYTSLNLVFTPGLIIYSWEASQLAQKAQVPSPNHRA